ncbi:PREDICTED: zinc finger protein RFP-like [Gekko japonicus]|uniref:Zinc finger protein RFP-like n=1 Tax=Gekko japonicus TaxID=146911 RepID=A0ABM1KZJ0_GEKJA|nr:PREDICTED: zinc finger protein RFP-like [Gekko japonicus]
MAAAGPVQGLCEETTCPICLEYFRDPVTIDCGHNFCQACLTRYFRESSARASCPQCRKTFQQSSLRPNRHLANMVELVKKLERGKIREGKRELCERHQEPLKLFCLDDQALICCVCDRSKEHRHHSILPIDEVSQDYKEKIKVQQKSLEKERECVLKMKLAEEDEKQKCLTQIEAEKQKIRSAFEQMHKFLEEQEHLRLSQLKGLEEEIGKRNKENIDRLSEEISRLNRLISEMEGKCKQPATEFLQDIQGTMSRYAKKQVGHALVLSPGLEDSLSIYCEKNAALEKVMEKYKESLEQATKKVSLEETWNKAKVTLDPDTAHPHLRLSKDQKSVKWDSRDQFLPNDAERFDKEPCNRSAEREDDKQSISEAANRQTKLSLRRIMEASSGSALVLDHFQTKQ